MKRFLMAAVILCVTMSPTWADISFISFTIITDTPVRLVNALRSRGIIDADNQPTKRGLEIVEVPNLIIVTEESGTLFTDDYVGPVMDTRRVFLVKFAHEFETDEKDGDDCDRKSLLLCTKLGKWIAANSVADTITSADGRSWPARRVGDHLWFVDSPDFGVWQQ